MRSNMLGKRGIELAVNTLVVIVLGIIIIGSGIVIVNNITKTGMDLVDAVDSTTQNKIDNLLSQGELVAIPNSERESRENTFVLGYSNRLPATHIFEPNVTPINVIQKDGTVITYTPGTPPVGWDFPQAFIENFNLGIELQPNKQARSVPFSINMGAGSPRGTYTYSVKIYYNNTIATPTLTSADLYAQKLIRINII